MLNTGKLESVFIEVKVNKNLAVICIGFSHNFQGWTSTLKLGDLNYTLGSSYFH